MKRLVALTAFALVASPAFGKTKYEALETRSPIILTGEGGTRTTKHEIDYWTFGSPPRPHQVLGVINDDRGTGLIHGDAVGSKSVAKLVKQAGGDAVVIISRSERQTGVMTGGQSSTYGTAQGSVYGNTAQVSGQSQTYGSGWAVPISKASTTMIVVKYLPEEPAP